jgi:hypothetical protein
MGSKRSKKDANNEKNPENSNQKTVQRTNSAKRR